MGTLKTLIAAVSLETWDLLGGGVWVPWVMSGVASWPWLRMWILRMCGATRRLAPWGHQRVVWVGGGERNPTEKTDREIDLAKGGNKLKGNQKRLVNRNRNKRRGAFDKMCDECSVLGGEVERMHDDGG